MDRNQWIERERQWKRFHAWQQRLSLQRTLESRMTWFAHALEISRRFQGGRPALPREEKVERLRKPRDGFGKFEVP